jgi:hypothetical protein
MSEKGHMKLWMISRANALHRACERVALDLSRDVRPGKAYARARHRFNQSKVARTRGMTLSVSSIRAHYARWRINPTPSCFEARWGTARPSKIGVEFALELARRAIEDRITVSQLYSRLRREVPNLHFSKATLFRILPSAPISLVWAAHRKLNQAETAALRIVEGRTKVAAS